MGQLPENNGLSSDTNFRPYLFWPDVPCNLGGYFAMNILDNNRSLIYSKLYRIVDNQIILIFK
jgi:hypothetical protein